MGLLEHVLPAPLHRLALRVAHRLRTAWWRVCRPRLSGCRVLALDETGRVLLVRHSYGPNGWMPPGGGMRAGEDPCQSGARELHEEVGLLLTGARLVEVIEDILHGAGNRVHVVVGRTSGVPRPDGREVIAADFFALGALPANIAAGLAPRLARWLERAGPGAA